MSAAVYHNSGIPPRTTLQLWGSPVGGVTRIFSFPRALAKDAASQKFLRQPDAPEIEVAKAAREQFATPSELFAKIGQPIAPQWKVDFLIGFRVHPGEVQEIVRPNYCEDPLLCAGVLARCAGTLFLCRRAPEFSWETLLDLPIAFDDPLVSF